MSCLPCAKANNAEQDIFKYYKGVYDKTGKLFYIYKLSPKDGYKVVEKSYFTKIFNDQIKPNLKNGAEYYSIQEVTGD